MTKFYQVITATEKEDLDSIEFPCTIIVWEPTEEARGEAVDLIFKDIRRRYTFWLPTYVAIVSWAILIAISILSHLGKI